MAKKKLNMFIKNNEQKQKMKDSEILLKRLEFMVENELIDPSTYTFGAMQNFNGLDLKNLKKNWEY